MSRHVFIRQKFAEKPFTFLLRSFSKLVFATIAAFFMLSTARAAGPLTVSSGNPSYFFDSSGVPVYLAGTYVGQDAIQPGIEDFTAYLDLLQQRKHNFTRLWAWEQTPESARIPILTLPYERTGSGLALDGGSKFDLRRLNQTYFDQLRARVVQAQQRGIYVSVVLFQSLNSSSKKQKGTPWTAHPFNRDNNVNGMNGDANGNGIGDEIFTAAIPAVTSLQEAYIRKVVDTLNDLDNVLYQINGDGPLGNAAWQYYVINYLKNYQATKLKQHPVGIGYLSGSDSDTAFNSPADWIAFYSTDLNPPLALGKKVLVLETNPNLLGDRLSHQSIWKSFARGFNIIVKETDSPTPGVNENLQAAITQSLAYSEILNLSVMTPNDVVCSTGYCLMNPGIEYLIYLPSGGGVAVDLSGIGQRFLVNWFNPISGETVAAASTVGGSQVTLKSPFTGESVLYLLVQSQTQSQSVTSSTTSGTSSGVTTQSSSNVTSSSSTVSTPTITPNGGSFAGSVSVSLANATAGAKIYYTVDGSTPTQLSSQYSSPVTISSNVLFKAKAFKAKLNPSAVASAWFAKTSDFDFTLSNSSSVSVVAGSSVSNTISATLAVGSSQSVLFTVSGLPSGATGTFSASSCSPACSSMLAISTAGATPAGSSTITVSASGGGVTKTTTFTLTVSSPVQSVATPTISPSGGTFTSAITVPIATTTAGASIYYTTDGSAPTQSSRLYSAAINLTSDTRVKAKAFKSGYDPSAEASALFTIQPFNFSIATSGVSSINAGASTTQTVSTTLVSGSSQTISFSVSGLPFGATSSFSSASCSPACSTVLTITTTGSTPAGSYPVTITAAGGAVIRSALFNLSVTAALVVATPTFTPNGGAFTDSVSVAIQSPTAGAAIYYTTDGSTPTLSSLLYTGPMTLTGSATVKAAAFKTGYTQSAMASASFAVSSTSVIYYVSKSGTDSNSCAQARTSNAPKSTISAALACIGTTVGAGAGKFVEVAAGTYNERLIGNMPGGASWASPFTLRAKPGDAVAIAPTSSEEYPMLEPHSSYAIIQGFILDGRGQIGAMVRLYGSYIRLVNNELKNVDGDNGIYFANGAHHNEIIGGSIHDGLYTACPTCGGGGTAYPIYLEGNNNLIEGINIYNFPRYGIHVNNGYSGSHADNNTIRKNKLHNGSTAWPSGSAIIVYTGTGNAIYNNIVYGMTGHGLIIGATNNMAYNNTVYGGQQTGIYVYPGAQNAIVKNNIVYGNTTAQILNQGTGTVLSNNLTAFNPLFTAPSSADFRLQSGSPAIDAGTNVSPVVTTDFDGTARPQGSGFDIGAFEHRF